MIENQRFDRMRPSRARGQPLALAAGLDPLPPCLAARAGRGAAFKTRARLSSLAPPVSHPRGYSEKWRFTRRVTLGRGAGSDRSHAPGPRARGARA